MGGNSTHTYAGAAKSAIRATDNFQCFALDSTTSENDPELPVVVAVGANYTQGNPNINYLPRNSPSGYLSCSPWVEENLSAARGNFETFFAPIRRDEIVIDVAHCNTGRAKEIWTTENNEFSIYTNAGQRGKDPHYGNPSTWTLPDPGNYHLVMTNFCPFITNDTWSDIRDNSPWISQELLAYGLGMSHLVELQNALNNHIQLWLGHGFYDIYYHFYTYLVKGYALRGFIPLAADEWLFTCNSRQNPQNPTQKTVCP